MKRFLWHFSFGSSHYSSASLKQAGTIYSQRDGLRHSLDGSTMARNFAPDRRYSISQGLKSHSEKLRIPGPRAWRWRLHQLSAPTIHSHRRRSCEPARALISRHEKRLPLSITEARLRLPKHTTTWQKPCG